jgi:hypothetical protein
MYGTLFPSMMKSIRQDQQEEKDKIASYLISVKLSDIQLKWLPIQGYEEKRPCIPLGELPGDEP